MCRPSVTRRPRGATGYRPVAAALALAIGACGGRLQPGPVDAVDFATAPRTPVGPTPARPCGPPRLTGTVEDEAVTETSGLAASPRRADVYYLHNDSGDVARLFAIDGTGRTLAELHLEGVSAFDWEGLAIGPADDGSIALHVGDFGDNHHVRPHVTVYRFPEPTVAAGTEARGTVPRDHIDAIGLVYPDGEHPDAEALLGDWETGDLFIVTKEARGAPRIFGLDAPVRPGSGPFPLELAGEVRLPGTVASPLVTDAALSPSGDAILVRTYDDALLYRRAEGQSIPDALARMPIAVPVASEPQGESITFDHDGRGYLTISEGGHPKLWRVSLCDADGV